MRWTNRAKWKRRFSLIPVLFGDQWIWLEWYWIRDYGDCSEISLTDPKETDDGR